jgi:hypothetical protein
MRAAAETVAAERLTGRAALGATASGGQTRGSLAIASARLAGTPNGCARPADARAGRPRWPARMSGPAWRHRQAEAEATRLTAGRRPPPPPVAHPRPGRGADPGRAGGAVRPRSGLALARVEHHARCTDGSCARPGTSFPATATTTLVDGQVHSRGGTGGVGSGEHTMSGR